MQAIDRITFTGSDCRTSTQDLEAIAEASKRLQIHVEIAVLLSPSRCGVDRYPNADTVRRIAEDTQRFGLRFAVHACGSASRSLIAGRVPALELGWGFALALASLEGRVQINAAAKDSTPSALQAARHALATIRPDAEPSVIGQWRHGPWPEEAPHEGWLFDRSGGRGEPPLTWPALPSGRLVGLAGGIGPGGESGPWVLDRVLDHLHASRGCKVWLDMESNIRSPSEAGGTVLSPEKCIAVLERVAAYRMPADLLADMVA